MRRWVWSTTPSSQPISMCLPRLFTRSMVLPRLGMTPRRRGASKPVMIFSSSAARNAVADRWMVSPSGTRSAYAAGRATCGPPVRSPLASSLSGGGARSQRQVIATAASTTMAGSAGSRNRVWP